jgi:hypothetical protein
MDKSELIKKWEEEIANYESMKKYSSPINWEQGVITGNLMAILDCLNDVKQLNEESVKRSELIDFYNYFLSHKISETIVDDYLEWQKNKSINSSEA